MIEKIKELGKDTAVYGVSTIVGRFLNFLLVPFYTWYLSLDDFGIYTYIYAFIAFLNIVYIYGMDSAFLKFSSIASESNKKETFSTAFIFVILINLLLSFVFFINVNPISITIDLPSKYIHLLYYAVFILFLDSAALVPFANLRLERKTIKFAVIKIINIVVNLGLNIVLIVVYEYGIEAIFISNLVASLITLVALIPEIIRNLKFSISSPLLIRMLKFGLPYLPASLAAMMVQMIDVPVLRSLTNDATVAIYRANYKLGIFMMLFVQMFRYAWQPFFLTNAKEKNAKEMFSKIFTLFVITACSIWIIISLFISDFATIEIMEGQTLIDQKYLGGLAIIPIILLGYIFHGMYVNFTAGIYIEEKTKYFPWITGIGAIVSVAINFIFIPIIGIYGAAAATLISYLIMAVGLFLVSQKWYKIQYEYGKVAKILLIGLLIIGCYYYFLSNDQLSLLIKFILLILFLVSLVIFRIISKEEIKATIKMFLPHKSYK